jgi:hypothetical protein
MLESAVWRVIDEFLLSPGKMIAALETDLFSEKNQSVGDQIAYLDGEIAKLQTEDEKLYKAYMLDVFDAQEFADKRRMLKDRQNRLNIELKRLKPTHMTKQQFESEKAQMIDTVAKLRKELPNFQPSFGLKRKLLKQYVDVIRFDTNAGTFSIEGKLSAVPIVSTWATASGQAAGR